MACQEPRMTALKVAHKGEIHRVRVELSTFNFVALNALFSETFSLSPGSFVVQYSDAEGDVLNVTSEAEYAEACTVFLSTADAVKSLRFNAVSRTQVMFQEKVADPILKAIERLVETLTAAMEKVKQGQWAERAQSGMEQTGDAIKTGVEHTSGVIKVGVEHTSVALNAAAKDARESLSAAHKQIQEQMHEIQFDQMLKDTSDGLKVAADNISAFALDLVEEMKKLQIPVPVQPVPAQESEGEMAPVEPVQPAEPDWEQVEEQAVPVAEPIEETPVVVVAEPEVVEVIVSEEAQKWATQISMVRDIFPAVDALRVIDALEQCNGNVEVVLNSLMEEM